MKTKDIVINTINKFPKEEVNNDLTAVYNELKIIIERNDKRSENMSNKDLDNVQRLKDALRLMSKYIPDDNEMLEL